VEKKYKARERLAKVEPALEEQFQASRVLGEYVSPLSQDYLYLDCDPGVMTLCIPYPMTLYVSIVLGLWYPVSYPTTM